MDEGDRVHLLWSVLLPPDEPAVKSPTENELPDTIPFEDDSVDVILETRIHEFDGSSASVEWFSEYRAVDVEKLSPPTACGVSNRELTDLPVYPVHHRSPYTSLDELAADIKRKTEG